MLRLKQRLIRSLTALRRRGFGFILYLAVGYLIPKIAYHLLYRIPRPRLRQILLIGNVAIVFLAVAGLALLFNFLTSLAIVLSAVAIGQLVRLGVRKVEILKMQRKARLFTERARSHYSENTFTSWEEFPLSNRTRKAIDAQKDAHPEDHLVIGRFDDDGKVLGVFGELPDLGLDKIEGTNFVERNRYSIDLVLIDDKVLIRKDFRKDKIHFIKEWYCLSLLYGKANVSTIYSADASLCVLYKNFILGRKVRDILIDRGARIRDVDIEKDPEIKKLDPITRAEIFSERGRALLGQCFSENFLKKLEQQVNCVHCRGITNFGFTIGNVIVDQEENPWFFDFEGAKVFKSLRSLTFAYRRDQDRIKFNRFYGDRLLTESSARSLLSVESSRKLSETKTMGLYAPIDYGNGLALGGLGSTETGTGRWECFNKYIVPQLVKGKRVLDLGINNGLMPIMMLKSGALEVIGVELSPELVARARLSQRIFEWRDMREYALTIYNCDMLNILDSDWGRFDVVSAYCSLYFLEAEDMARVVNRASKLSSVFILQANLRVKEAADGRAERATTGFLKELLEDNGFDNMEVFAPAGYPRPLIVGKATRN